MVPTLASYLIALFVPCLIIKIVSNFNFDCGTASAWTNMAIFVSKWNHVETPREYLDWVASSLLRLTKILIYMEPADYYKLISNLDSFYLYIYIYIYILSEITR